MLETGGPRETEAAAKLLRSNYETLGDWPLAITAYNYGTAGTGTQLRPGLVLALEPMITLGTYDVETQADGWTVVTLDGRPSAHTEHTIAITEEGPDVLTRVVRAERPQAELATCN